MLDVGVPVQIRDADSLALVGTVHAPAPVTVGDLLALEHGQPLRVVVVFERQGGAYVPVLARPAPLATVAR